MQLLLFCFSFFFFQYHVYIFFVVFFFFQKRSQKESHTLCSMNVCIFNLFVVCQNEDLKHDAGVVTSKREDEEEEEEKIPRMISLCICAMVGAGEGAGCLLEGGVCRKLETVAKSLKILKGVFHSRGV